MSETAVVKIDGVGDAKSAAKTFPVTLGEVANSPDESIVKLKPVIAVLAIGLTPMSPTILVVTPVLEMPAFASTAKSAAVPRLTSVAPLVGKAASVREAAVMNNDERIDLFFI